MRETENFSEKLTYQDMSALRVKLTDEQKDKIMKSLEEHNKVVFWGLGRLNLHEEKNGGNKMGGPDTYPVLTFQTSQDMKKKLRDIT